MFAHLHMHTEYSLLDGASRIEPLLDKIQALGMTHCAITDHGAMYGVVDFYQQALKRGIHPVIGCEVYICKDLTDKSSGARDYSHLILLCENQKGYENLIYTGQPRLCGRLLLQAPHRLQSARRAARQGLIGLSACISGDIPSLLLDGREHDARAMAQKYLDIFGRGNFFIEIQDHGLENQKRVLPGLIDLAREMDIPLVATNDCHYINREDAQAQEVLMCIQTGKTLGDEKRMRMECDEMYRQKRGGNARGLSRISPRRSRTPSKSPSAAMWNSISTRRTCRAFRCPRARRPKTICVLSARRACKRHYAPDRQDARERLEYELSRHPRAWAMWTTSSSSGIM